MRVIVTGGAGYIGGATVLKLLDAGHSVLAIDRAMPPDHLIDCGAKWHTGDFANDIGLACITSFDPDAIIHCAGTSLVGPSIANPAEYYDNNFVKTKAMLDYVVKNKLTNIRVIFSSSAATYGNPIMTPVNEVDPTEPISPYGQSKLMIDWMLPVTTCIWIRFCELSLLQCLWCRQSRLDTAKRPGATHIIAEY
jgi:UDP-glucose 4-epimerase